MRPSGKNVSAAAAGDEDAAADYDGAGDAAAAADDADIDCVAAAG